MGGPKALLRDADGVSWLVQSIDALRGGGCEAVSVVLGAGADEARLMVPESTEVVLAEDWEDGMGASLRAGLLALAPRTEVEGVLVGLVDLPDVGAAVVARVLSREVTSDTLRRATYAGSVGHPVVIGRSHWAGVIDTAVGDRGARDYLATHPAELVECGDLASGHDVDTPGAANPRPTGGQPGAE